MPLPADAPSVAAHLAERAGYRTALLGKAHFEPGFDLEGRWPENVLAREGSTGPHRGFDHLELCMHGPEVLWHYGRWLKEQDRHAWKGFYQLFNAEGTALNEQGGGETGAPQVAVNPIARELYHTDWVADRTIAYLDGLADDEDWFVWMSFPDPHHPWDPPADEVRARIDWRDVPLPAGHPGSVEACEEVLRRKPAHWLAYFDGTMRNEEGGPAAFVPKAMTHDQLREVDALTHVENELVDEACGRVLDHVEQRGWGPDTDVFFTTDHGDLQGDFGLLFKGPYHVDALMRLPFVWRPAPAAGVAPAVVTDPVGHLDLAATFCSVAGVEVPSWVQGEALPTADGSGRERVLCEWDSQFPQMDIHLRSIYRDGWLATAYEPGWGGRYDGSEGELYDLEADPLQHENRWDEPAQRAWRDELVADLYEHLPEPREPRLTVEAPV